MEQDSWLRSEAMRILLITLFYPPQRNAGTEQYTRALARALARRGHEVQVVCAGAWEAGARYWNGVTVEVEDGVIVQRVNLDWRMARDPNRHLYESAVVGRWLERLLGEDPPDVVHVTSAMTLGVDALDVPHRLRIPLVLTLMDFWFACPRTVLMRGDGRLCDGRVTAWECQQCLLAGWRPFELTNRRLRALAGPVWRAAARLPLVARVRGLRGRSLNMEHRHAAMRAALRRPDVILAHSKFVRDVFLSAGFGVKVDYLAQGHDLGWRGHFRAKKPSPVVRFAYMGQLTHTKGVHLLIDAFRRAHLDGQARLDIWGETTSREPSEAHRSYVHQLKAAINGFPAIQLRGGYRRERLAQVLEEIDVLVVPSIWYENAPLVIQEAFATGTPVIATRLGGMAESVTEGVNGLLFERNDVSDLARQIGRMVHEPGLLQALARGVPEVKTVEQEIRELESIYLRLVSKRSQCAS